MRIWSCMIAWLHDCRATGYKGPWHRAELQHFWRQCAKNYWKDLRVQSNWESTLEGRACEFTTLEHKQVHARNMWASRMSESMCMRVCTLLLPGWDAQGKLCCLSAKAHTALQPLRAPVVTAIPAIKDVPWATWEIATVNDVILRSTCRGRVACCRLRPDLWMGRCKKVWQAIAHKHKQASAAKVDVLSRTVPWPWEHATEVSLGACTCTCTLKHPRKQTNQRRHAAASCTLPSEQEGAKAKQASTRTQAQMHKLRGAVCSPPQQSPQPIHACD